MAQAMENFKESVDLVTAQHLGPWADRAAGAAAPPPVPVTGSAPPPALPAPPPQEATPGPAEREVHRRRASKIAPDIPQAALTTNPETSKRELNQIKANRTIPCAVRPYDDMYRRTEQGIVTKLVFLSRKEVLHMPNLQS